MNILSSVLLAFVFGAAVAVCAYLLLGLVRRGSGESVVKSGTGGSAAKKKAKKKTDDDDDISTGKASGPSLTPTKEWVGGARN